MEELRKLLSFSKSERIAILAILAALLLLLLACLFRRPQVSLDEASLHNLDSLLALHQEALDSHQVEQASYQVPIESRKMPEGSPMPKRAYTRPKKPTEWEATKYEPRVIPVVDLNSVDSATLVELPQIGAYSAMQIIRYRDRLGGYVDLEQLREVKWMDSARFAVASPYITLDTVAPRQIDVNRDDFRTLLRHPYLSYEQVKRIFNQREKRGMIKNWKQLETLLREEGEVNPWLEKYVRF